MMLPKECFEPVIRGVCSVRRKIEQYIIENTLNLQSYIQAFRSDADHTANFAYFEQNMNILSV